MVGNGVAGCKRIVIDECDYLPRKQRVGRRRRRVLILPVDVEGEPSVLGASGESGRIVNALLIGTAVVVDDRLAQGCCRSEAGRRSP